MFAPDDKPQTALPPACVQVLVPAPLAAPLDYRVPAAMSLQIGDYVRVPLGRRSVTGVVWGTEPAQIAPDKLRAIDSRCAVPAMPEVLRRFLIWVSQYTLQPLGLVLKLALTVDSAQEAAPQSAYIGVTPQPAGLAMTKARQRVLAVLADGQPRTQAELAAQAACSPQVVRGLYQAQALEKVLVPTRPLPAPDAAVSGPPLSPEQHKAAAQLVAAVHNSKHSVTLLEGVTGSGKTEVFTTAIRAALKQGRQVLILMPEIALSVQMFGRFSALLGAPPILWHSDLTASERQRNWRAIASGEARVILGARSALFLPFSELGLIVVDEEHESAYKQEEGITYHGRDMAIVRAHLGDVPIILSSATPALESLVNVAEGRYQHATLPNRHAGASMPEVRLVDMLKESLPRQRFIAPSSEQAIRDTLARGEQVLLFLNRRGYAPLTLCRACGYRLTCPHCTSWLVEHRMGRARSQLQCHHCGYHQGMPSACPSCQQEGKLVPCGPGVERLEDEVKSLFPAARCSVVASDAHTSGAALQRTLEAVSAGEVDIIIGTQLVAKGHHFPMLTLVVCVDADLGLDGSDLRARERSFQLLEQVSGRAGRAEHKGTVLLQTHCASNFMFQTLAQHDRASFIAQEMALRAQYHWPPYARLAALIISGRDEQRVLQGAQEIRITSPQVDGVEIFGPAPAPLARLKGQHRMRVLVRAPRYFKLQNFLLSWLRDVKLPTGVDLKIVIDPFTFL